MEGPKTSGLKLRKCSATSRIITAKQHGAVQIEVGKVDENGRYIIGQNDSFIISESVRKRGESDAALNHLFNKEKLLTFSH